MHDIIFSIPRLIFFWIKDKDTDYEGPFIIISVLFFFTLGIYSFDNNDPLYGLFFVSLGILGPLAVVIRFLKNKKFTDSFNTPLNCPDCGFDLYEGAIFCPMCRLEIRT